MIDRERIIAILTNYIRIEDDSEEWQSPSPYISGKTKAADEILRLLATPQAEPQDESKANALMLSVRAALMDDNFDGARELIGNAFAAIRAERAAGSRDIRQQDVSNWCAAAFGADHAASIPQRGIRHVEEAIEAAQAAQCEREMVHKLVDYVFGRPVGDLRQEIGGSGLTLLALAQAAGISADKAECAEITRVLAKPLDHFAKRNRAKNDAGFGVAPSPPQDGK